MPKQSNRINDLLASVTEDLLGDGSQEFQDNSIRVERILLEMVRPDPIQPRRVLPERVHQAFHNNRLTPTQALRELVQTAQVAARQRGQPFQGVLDLLNISENEDDQDQEQKYSPEEQLLRDLINLAMTIRDDGQVNPLTVVDVSQGVTRLYRIETGERRYWASWLLRDFIPGYTGDGMIPCIVIPMERSSVFRQAKENAARTGLSAIAMARQAALLLLAVHGYEMPSGPVDNDFYRQALELDLRSKREYTELILAAMGGISKVHFHRYKSLLQLSDDAMEMADRYDLDEFRLRPVLDLASEAQAEMVRQIVQFGLTGRQVKEICDQGLEKEGGVPEPKLSPTAMRMVRLVKTYDQETPDNLARALLQEEHSIHVARAKLQAMIAFLQDVNQFLLEK
jgi:ParB-like chromosome segregation protein Spo0J